MHVKTNGFTVVEVAVVIAVIGVLAAITIVSYASVRDRSYDLSVQSDFVKISDEFKLFKIDNKIYPTTVNGVTNMKIPVNKSAYAVSPATQSNITVCYSADGMEIGLMALSKSGKAFYMNSAESLDPKVLTTAWDPNADTRCQALSSNLGQINPATGLARNYNGYNVNDTTTGPWRAWVGGN